MWIYFFQCARKFGFCVNSPRYRKHVQFDNDTFEVEMEKNKIVFKLPLIIGFFVYNYAKLIMLQFYYDFLDKWIDRSYFEPIQMDTDSMYFAFGEESLNQYIQRHKPWLFDDWKVEKSEYLAYDDEDIEVDLQTRLDSQRTPGLFKLEWSGDRMVALNSKTYVGSERVIEDGRVAFQVTKKSHKGLSKRTNDMEVLDYEMVIRTKEEKGGINRGFVVKNNDVLMYEQERDALSYLYVKRIVLDDKSSTLPLEL